MSKIITTTDLGDHMGKTIDDAIAQVVVDGINQFVEDQTHRIWGETRQITDRYNWSPNLWLRHADLVSVDSIKLGWPGQTQTTLSSASYFSNSLGRITMLGYAFYMPSNSIAGHDYVEVTATFGALTIPASLKMAALGIAAGFYNWAVSDNKDVASVSVDTYRVEYVTRTTPDTSNPAATNREKNNWLIIQSFATRRV